ncbi:MAG: protein-L-isoaspartate O-methyltransferase [Actinomycetota bacterium]|nr:protein-L-isoaspartate O-methyltransferase [Actinomycetota bacterium]
MGPSDRVEEAMRAAPRRDYLPMVHRWAADQDRAIRIGHGSTCSQPSTVRAMLELLETRPGDRVLDVGSGSGWTTAILAHLVGPEGSVRGTELVPELVRDAARRLSGAGLAAARVQQADPDVLGDPEHAPYDRILVSAETDRMPQALVDQLAEGGRLVLPLEGRLTGITRHGQELSTMRAPGYYRFVPLQGS